MAGLQPTLSDPDFKNWVKSGLSLQYTKDGIENFVDNIINNLHQDILKIVGFTCNKCTSENIIKCERNNNFCKFFNRSCLVHDQSDPSKRNMLCPLAVCDTIRDKIIANHRYGKPAWKNTDARQWCANKWMIAVCYMSEGYSQKTSASDTDLPGLLNVVINNTYFQTFVTDNLLDDNNIFIQARRTRNDILHNPRQRMTNDELKDHIAILTALLADTKCLLVDQNAVDATFKLQQILQNTISITTQHEGQIRAEAINALREAGQDILDNSTEAIADKSKDALTQIDDAKVKAVDAVKEQTEELTAEIAKRGKHSLKRIAKVKIESLDTFEKKKAKLTEDIGKIRKQSLKQVTKAKSRALRILTKKKDKLVQAIGETSKNATQASIDGIKEQTTFNVKTLTDKTEQYVVKMESMINTSLEDLQRKQKQESIATIQVIRKELILLYQMEPRFLTTPLFPLIQRSNRNIEDLYVPPNMRTVDKETMLQNKDHSVKSIDDIFSDNSKTIYVVGDAGMGKSSLCKKIVSDWCKTKSEKEQKDKLSIDLNAISEFSFVFFISLRECNTDIDIIDMLKHQLLDEIPECDNDTTLHYILRNEKCLILLDGLDEWTPNVNPSTSNRSNFSTSIPYRKGVRNCSILTTTRAWKLEYIRLESSQIDIQIELLGIGVNSYEKLIRHMVNQIDPKINIDKFLDEFLTEVQNKNLEKFLSIPVILKQLVCVWHADKNLRDTKSSVYSQMLNLLLDIAQSRLQNNDNYKEIKASNTQTVSLPECFAEDKKCQEFGPLVYSISKLAFETLLSDTPESALVFEMSTTTLHGLTSAQVSICLDIGIISQTRYTKNYITEQTKLSFLHKTYQEFLAALWISLKTNEFNKSMAMFTKKCHSISSMFELSEFLKFQSGMNSEVACKLAEHTKEIVTKSDIIKEYRHTSQYSNRGLGPRKQISHDIRGVQDLTTSCINEGWDCTHTHSHLYLEDMFLDINNPAKDIPIISRLLHINKLNIKSIAFVNDMLVFNNQHNGISMLNEYAGTLLEISGLEKLDVCGYALDFNYTINGEDIIQRLVNRSVDTIISFSSIYLFLKDVAMLQSTRCLINLSLVNVQLPHDQMTVLMSFLSERHSMKDIHLTHVHCIDCGNECSAVLDLSQHDHLEYLDINVCVVIRNAVNSTSLMECTLGNVEPVASYVNVTKGLSNAEKLNHLYFNKTSSRGQVAAMVECINNVKHIRTLHLSVIDFGSHELVLFSDSINLEYLHLDIAHITKRSFCGLIDSILACKQTVHVEVSRSWIEPKEDINDAIDYVRQCLRCLVIRDDEEMDIISKLIFKTVPVDIQHT